MSGAIVSTVPFGSAQGPTDGKAAKGAAMADVYPDRARSVGSHDGTLGGPQNPANGESKPRKLTYKEQRELETLEKDIETLTEEKADLESKLQGGLTDVSELQKVSARFSEVSEKLDALETRWLELSI